MTARESGILSIDFSSSESRMGGSDGKGAFKIVFGLDSGKKELEEWNMELGAGGGVGV